ncbi:hypothetical protein COO91_02313 [Nostoc flagelliforme CCNUN1]|uniref:Uncharacterized protein n=1 Tax=Nostoc flagelliforme CCNUN1 TaxID=2038116 RepID=A0A2K8SLT8_9NOSO|nr:hypothetical protein COO91_02313 [Nostoc flagelliforme CCNUN1]
MGISYPFLSPLFTLFPDSPCPMPHALFPIPNFLFYGFEVSRS